jgi:hypothetical protein
MSHAESVSGRTIRSQLSAALAAVGPVPPSPQPGAMRTPRARPPIVVPPLSAAAPYAPPAQARVAAPLPGGPYAFPANPTAPHAGAAAGGGGPGAVAHYATRSRSSTKSTSKTKKKVAFFSLENLTRPRNLVIIAGLVILLSGGAYLAFRKLQTRLKGLGETVRTFVSGGSANDLLPTTVGSGGAARSLHDIARSKGDVTRSGTSRDEERPDDVYEPDGPPKAGGGSDGGQTPPMYTPFTRR